MKFGLLYEMQRPHEDYKVDYTALIEETLEQCQLADEVGFDYLWFVEHHFLTTFSGSSAPEVIISSLARLTKRIRLGFGVGDSGEPPPDTGSRASGHGGPPVRRSRGVRRWEEQSLRATGHGGGPAGHARAYGRVAADGAGDLAHRGQLRVGRASFTTSRRGRYCRSRSRTRTRLSGWRARSRRATRWRRIMASACSRSARARRRA